MNLSEARQILEIDVEFTDVELKKNYRRLAKQVHPDKCKDPSANEKFSKINEAYVLLSNSDKHQFPEFIIDSLFNSFFKDLKKNLVLDY